MYKRQGQEGAEVVEDIADDGGPADLGQVQLLTGQSRRAVSYTHLDVYKRQGQHLAVILAQQSHDLVFGHGELGVLPPDQHLVLVIVDGQVPGGEFAGLGNLGIGQGGAGCLLYTSRCV